VATLRQLSAPWCEQHQDRSSLQIAVVDVDFRGDPDLFAKGEGVLVAPVAVDLPGAQRVIDTASQPAGLRLLRVQGNTELTWAYSGRVHRDLHFTGVALVERSSARPVAAPEHPSFDTLPAAIRLEALAKVADTEEHGLHRCKAFADWARTTAGEPPYTAQFRRLVAAVGRRPGKKSDDEDVCAALRTGRFTPHWAQVAVVLGAREIGMPAMAFAAASRDQLHLVGTYVDGIGWVMLDIDRPDDGWFAGGAPLITMAPLVGGFAASSHDLWYPNAAVYSQEDWGMTTLSRTEWMRSLEPSAKRTDTTDARSYPLEELCR
jgi:hypothetical protein